MDLNLRHLRVFLAVVELSSVTQAATACNLSQPAVTQAIGKLEQHLGAPLFDRTARGLFVNPTGRMFARRVARALGILDSATGALAPRLKLTATAAKLRALVAVAETRNFALAARRLGIAQPTVHRAVSQLEQDLGRPLFRRTPHGTLVTRAGQNLATAAQLAFAEFAQGEMEVGHAAGQPSGTVTIGAMPLSRSHVLPRVIAAFRERHPRILVRIVEAPYSALLDGLHKGEIDVLVGALRTPVPAGDLEQIPLFDDDLVVVARPDHPLSGEKDITFAEALDFPWVVAAPGTPARAQFDKLVADLHRQTPPSIVETGSMILMRELLLESDHLGCISGRQIESEVRRGLLVRLPLTLAGTRRPIGLTRRKGWEPTAIQADVLRLLRERFAEPVTTAG